MVSLTKNCLTVSYQDYILALATAQAVAIKLYKLLNIEEKLKHSHTNKSFNQCN